VKRLIVHKVPLPLVTFELGVEMLLLGKAGAKISDELPRRGGAEGAANFCRIEDRYPADADALRPRREPKRMNRSDHRIIERLRHGFLTKPKACFGRMVAEDGKVNRRVMQSREFEAGIERGALPFIGFERGRVAGIEVRNNPLARRRRFHADKTPRLAVADRRGKGSGSNEALDKRWRQGIRLETADIAPPGEEVGKPTFEGIVELRRYFGSFAVLHGHAR